MNIKTALILVTIALAHGVYFTSHAHAQPTTKETTKGCGSCTRPSCGGCR